MGKRLAMRSWTRYSISTACRYASWYRDVCSCFTCTIVIMYLHCHKFQNSMIRPFRVKSHHQPHDIPFFVPICVGGRYTCIHVSILHAPRSRNASYNTTQMKRSMQQYTTHTNKWTSRRSGQPRQRQRRPGGSGRGVLAKDRPVTGLVIESWTGHSHNCLVGNSCWAQGCCLGCSSTDERVNLL